MYENDLINLINDPVIPDLLPEEPVYDNLLPLEYLMMFVPQPELIDLSRKFESLNLDTNTHGLRIEIERSKRQRLQTIVRQLRHDLSVARDDVTVLRNEINQLRDQQNAVNFQLNNDNARTNALAFRSLSRIGQILALGPINTQPFENYNEIETLLQELNSTIRLFGVYYAASYV